MVLRTLLLLSHAVELVIVQALWLVLHAIVVLLVLLDWILVIKHLDISVLVAIGILNLVEKARLELLGIFKNSVRYLSLFARLLCLLLLDK